jgi:hypothetical protein
MGACGQNPTRVLVVDRDGSEVIVGEVDASRPDLALIDALARLQLVAMRRGRRMRLCCEPTSELCGLLALVGLSGALGVEPGRQAEVGEVLGADEVMQSRDPPV